MSHPATPAAASDTWMSISDAAVILGCSTRTVARRLAAGELRRQERDGRVYVAVPESLRRPADRMVEAVQQDAAHMRQLSAAVTQATEQAGMVLREAVAQAREDAAAALLRADTAETRSRRAWWLAAGLGVAAVIGMTATVSVTQEAARLREEGRQMAATVSEARERAAAAEAQRDAAEGILAFLAGADTERQETATPERAVAGRVPADSR